MDKITSFTIDHLKLLPGVYVSRKDRVGDQVITTFDIRMTRPNYEPVMNTAEVHTIEHLAATWLRNNEEWKDRVLYFGPMGCRTGFYLLTAGISFDEAYVALREGMDAAMRMDEVPGSAKQECGNYLEHDLALAKAELSAYAALLGDEAALDADREAYAEAARR